LPTAKNSMVAVIDINRSACKKLAVDINK